MRLLFDTNQVRRAFSRAASGYSAAADLQMEVQKRLFEDLDLFESLRPSVIVDVGAGTCEAAQLFRKKFPKSTVIALDNAMPMLRQSAIDNRDGQDHCRVVGDACALPLRSGSVDILFCNLCLQWMNDLSVTFAEFARVLRPDGLLLCSTFGDGTLHELQEAFAAADAFPHVIPFCSIAQFGAAILDAGFCNPVLDSERFTLFYEDFYGLLRQLRALGATNALSSRRRTLTGRKRFSAAQQVYETYRDANGKLPSTWQVISAHAWMAPKSKEKLAACKTSINKKTIPLVKLPFSWKKKR